MATKYEFPCYPGDEVWYIERYNGRPLYIGKDKVQMIGFTTQSVQIKLRDHQSFGKTFTWVRMYLPPRLNVKQSMKNLRRK